MSDTGEQQGPGPSPWASGITPPQGLQGPPQAPQDVHDIHDQATTHYNQLKKIDGRLQAMIKGLGALVKLADTVTAEDVVDEAAKLLHQGFSAMEMATTLAEMPADGGEALAGWVKQQVAQAQANDAKLGPALQAARHQMGVSALHSILGHQLGTPSAAPNPLAPGGAQ